MDNNTGYDICAECGKSFPYGSLKAINEVSFDLHCKQCDPKLYETETIEITREDMIKKLAGDYEEYLDELGVRELALITQQNVFTLAVAEEFKNRAEKEIDIFNADHPARRKAGQIINVVESLLRETYPTIEHIAENSEGNTLIYGEDYYDIEDELTFLIAGREII